MSINDVANVRISTTVEGYKYILSVINELKDMHQKNATKPNLPYKPKAWQSDIIDEITEAEYNQLGASYEITYQIYVDAKYLINNIIIETIDNKGVVFGWDDIDWDEETPTYSALRTAIDLSKHPMEFVRVTDLDDFEETQNKAYKNPNDTEYSIFIEPTIEIAYPPHWHKAHKRIKEPINVQDTKSDIIEGVVAIPLQDLIRANENTILELINTKLVTDWTPSKITYSLEGTEDDNILLHVKAYI